MGLNPEALGQVVPLQAGGLAAPPPPQESVAPTLTASDAIFPSPTGIAAGATQRNNHLVITFDDASDRAIHFENAITQNYGGSPITVNLFWAAATALLGDVEWFVAWERQNTGGPFDLDVDDFAAELGVVSTAPGTSGFLQLASLVFTQAQADAVAAGECFRLRIRRDGGVGNDNMVGDAQLLRVTLEGI
jgi:hypothetical protein